MIALASSTLLMRTILGNSYFMGHRSEYMSDGEIENMDRNVENATSVMNVINNAGPRAIGAILRADIPVDPMPILSDEELIEIDADRVSLDAGRRANLTHRVELAMIAARRRRTIYRSIRLPMMCVCAMAIGPKIPLIRSHVGPTWVHG